MKMENEEVMLGRKILYITNRMPVWAQWMWYRIFGRDHIITRSLRDLSPYQSIAGEFLAVLVSIRDKVKANFKDEDEGPIITFKVKDFLDALKKMEIEASKDE